MVIREITYTVYTRKFRKEKYTPKEIKEWVNDQKESGKKRTFDGGKFEFDNLELIEQDYKRKKANGGLSSDTWMYSGKHLFAQVREPTDDPDEWSTGQGPLEPCRFIFTNNFNDYLNYCNANWGNCYNGMK